MKNLFSLLFIHFSSLSSSSACAHAVSRPQSDGYVADIVQRDALAPRADQISTITESGGTSTITAFTFFTPSPGADPTPITSQGQSVTSYVPILTICPFIPSTDTLPFFDNSSFPAPTAPSSPAASASDGSALQRRQYAAASSGPYSNATTPTSFLSSCSVSYTPTTTQICATTLTPLASPVIPITDCAQQVTFSTDHGYTVVSGNRTDSIEDLTTYYAARWDVVANGVPTNQGIKQEICSTVDGGGCSTQWEAWSPSTGWAPEISTYEVGPPVSVTGPAVVILHAALPTMTVRSGETSPISVSTTLPASTSKIVVGIQRVPTSLGGVASTSGAAADAASAGAGRAQAAESTTTTTHSNTDTRIMTLQKAAGTGTYAKRLA